MKCGLYVCATSVLVLVEAIVFLNWTTFAIKLSIKTRLTSETETEKEEPNDRNQHQIGYLFIVVHALVSCALCHVVYLLKSLSVCLWLYSTFWHILFLFFSLFFRFNVNKSDAFAINTKAMTSKCTGWWANQTCARLLTTTFTCISNFNTNSRELNDWSWSVIHENEEKLQSKIKKNTFF